MSAWYVACYIQHLRGIETVNITCRGIYTITHQTQTTKSQENVFKLFRNLSWCKTLSRQSCYTCIVVSFLLSKTVKLFIDNWRKGILTVDHTMSFFFFSFPERKLNIIVIHIHIPYVVSSVDSHTGWTWCMHTDLQRSWCIQLLWIACRVYMWQTHFGLLA